MRTLRMCTRSPRQVFGRFFAPRSHMGASVCVCVHADAYSSPPMCGHTHCCNTLTTLCSRQSPIGHLLFVLFVYFCAHFVNRYMCVTKHRYEFNSVYIYKYTAKHTKILYKSGFLPLCVQLLSRVLCLSILPRNCRSKSPVREKLVFKWK